MTKWTLLLLTTTFLLLGQLRSNGQTKIDSLEIRYADTIKKADFFLSQLKGQAKISQWLIDSSLIVKTKTAYSSALLLKPNEQYPKDQILYIEQIIKDKSVKEKKFNDTISIADTAFANKRFLVARYYYMSALAINPMCAKCKAKTEACHAIINCTQYIDKGDSLFLKKHYTEAKRQYEIAKYYHCGDNNYCKNQITVCSNFITPLIVDKVLILDSVSTYIIYNYVGDYQLKGTAKSIDISSLYIDIPYYIVTASGTKLFIRTKK